MCFLDVLHLFLNILQTYNNFIYDLNAYGSATGSNNELQTGSWDDYFVSASVDPTGSYLTTFITTIGLYDSDYNMVGVAKLPKAIKKLPDYDLNFIIRIDT